MRAAVRFLLIQVIFRRFTGNAFRHARDGRRRKREKDATRFNKKPGGLSAIDLGLTRDRH